MTYRGGFERVNALQSLQETGYLRHWGKLLGGNQPPVGVIFGLLEQSEGLAKPPNTR